MESAQWVYSVGLVCVFITAVPIIKLFAWGKGDSGGHVLQETTSRGLCGLVCPSRTSERGSTPPLWLPRVRLCSSATGRMPLVVVSARTNKKHHHHHRTGIRPSRTEHGDSSEPGILSMNAAPAICGEPKMDPVTKFTKRSFLKLVPQCRAQWFRV